MFSSINLQVGQGEVFCLLGPNGCGKTTLLDTVLGHLKPLTGIIHLHGEDAAGMKSNRRASRIAYVPQYHEKSFPYTVFDVILMGRAGRLAFYEPPGEEDKDKTREVISLMGLDHLQDTSYTRISGGETQLVLIARALVQESRIIIMDEPTSHLDYTNEMIILETIGKLVKEKGISILMASHQPNHAFFLANRGVPVRVALMDGGSFHRIGTPEKVLHPHHIQSIYQIDTKLISFSTGTERELKHIVPLALSGSSDSSLRAGTAPEKLRQEEYHDEME